MSVKIRSRSEQEDDAGRQPDGDARPGTSDEDDEGYALVPGAGGFDFPRGYEMDDDFQRAFLRRFHDAHATT